MCVCGWQLVAAAVVLQLLITTYGEIEGRRRRNVARESVRHLFADHEAATEPRDLTRPSDRFGGTGEPHSRARRPPVPPERPQARPDRSPSPERTRSPPHPAPGAMTRRVPVPDGERDTTLDESHRYPRAR